MIRLALLAVLGLVILGCSTSRKVVVQNGYPGVKPPPGFEARPAPGPTPEPLHYVPDTQGAAYPALPSRSVSPPIPTNP